MRRVEQAILVSTFLCFSWLAMQVVHEAGHVIGASVTGAQVTHVALHPLIFSRTEIGSNPHPLIVVWSGAILGSAIPMLAFVLARALQFRGLYLFRFFAGFCCVVNGVYIACFPSDGLADSGVMALYGTPRWVMILFGLCTVPLGLFLWHRQGPYFGMGIAKGRVNRGSVIASSLMLATVVAAELILNSR